MSQISTCEEKNVSKTNSQFTEEFERYLKKQSLNATFNGCDIEAFSWYKKALGLGC